MDKAHDAFRTISEVATELGVPKHVLRFWESKFPQIKPMKRGGGRRFYRPEDMQLLGGIRHLLHADKYTIKGVQKILREQGVEAVKRAGISPSEPVSARQQMQTPSTAIAKRTRLTAKQKNLENARQVVVTVGSGDASRRDRVAQIDVLIQELEACRTVLVGKRQNLPRQTTTRKKNSGRKSRPARSA